MASPERLDQLVSRARALFELKHGSSEGCFAAYSPAKINVLGDAIEGSGGLALHVTVDRRVLVFGRGRLLNEQHAQTGAKKRISTGPPYAAAAAAAAGAGGGAARMEVVEEGSGGWEEEEEDEDEEDEGAEDEDDAPVSPKPLSSKWSKIQSRRKKTAATVGTMVQELVFGRKTRSKSVHTSRPFGGDGDGGRVSEVAGMWLKSGKARAAISGDWAPRGEEGEGGGAVGKDGGGEDGSSHSTPIPRYTAGFSRHGSSFHSSGSAPSNEAYVGSLPHGAAAEATRFDDGGGGGGNIDLASAATTPGTSNAKYRPSPPPPLMASPAPPRLKLSTPHRQGEEGEEEEEEEEEEYGFHATMTSGSTSAEEGFPVEPGGCIHPGGSSTSACGGGGRVGGGSGGSERGRRGSVDTEVTDAEASSHGSGNNSGDDGEHDGGRAGAKTETTVLGGVIEAAAAALAIAREAAGGVPPEAPPSSSSSLGGLPLSHPLLFAGSSSTDIGTGAEGRSEAGSYVSGGEGHEREGEREERGREGRETGERDRGDRDRGGRKGGDSEGGGGGTVEQGEDMIPRPPQPGGDATEKGAYGGVSGVARERKVKGKRESARRPDPAFARDSAEAAQAEADIEAAEVAEVDAERLWTSRIYCEACPDDGTLEFLTKRGMRGGGSSWKGLVTAVAAEYAQELPRGALVGLEAVVVSDFPGSAGQPFDPGDDVWGSGGGRGDEKQLQQVAAEGLLSGGGDGGGYGWGAAARCALLVASATFMEEVLGMGGFPRMKAMRCYSASLSCSKQATAGAGQKDAESSGIGRIDTGGGGGGGGTSSRRSSSSSMDSISSIDSKGSSSGSSNAMRLPESPRRSARTVPVDLFEAPGPSAEAAGAAGSDSLGGMRLEDLLAIAGEDPTGAQLVDSKWRTSFYVPIKGPRGLELSIVIAQPLSVETARRLRRQAEQERQRGAAACQAVLGVTRERLHPDTHVLRDVPHEVLDALVNVGTAGGQQQQAAAMAAAAAAAAAAEAEAEAQEEEAAAAGGVAEAGAPAGILKAEWGSLDGAGGGGGGSGWTSPVMGATPASFSSLPSIGRGLALVGSSGGSGGVSSGGRRGVCPKISHARHLAADIHRVVEMADALSTGDMESVSRVVLQSRRSAGLCTAATGSRPKSEPAEPAASRLVSMLSLLPGVFASGLSKGPGSAAIGAVVALVDPTMAEGVLRAVSTRGTVATGVAWRGFVAKLAGGSGIIRPNVVSGRTTSGKTR